MKFAMVSDVCDPNSRNGGKFRLHFRVSYPLCRNLLVPICLKVDKKVEVLIALSVLARAHNSDTMSELSEVLQSTCSIIFHQFIKNFPEKCFSDWVYIPRGADMRSVMDVYKWMGLNGAFGCVGCIHIIWRRCPVSLIIFALKIKVS